MHTILENEMRRILIGHRTAISPATGMTLDEVALSIERVGLGGRKDTVTLNFSLPEARVLLVELEREIEAAMGPRSEWVTE